jgi:hypothetical protein
MQKTRLMKCLATACLFLLGAGTASAQNQVVSGTLTVTKSVSLNTASGNTTIEGNTILGSSSFNTITFNGVAATNLDMGGNDIQDLQNLKLGGPSGSAFARTGTLTFYNAGGTGSFAIQPASPGALSLTYTIPNVGASASFVMTAGAQTIAGAKTFTTPIAATSGGTGTNTYAIGDILVANSTTTLTRLPAGGAGQVLGITPAGAVSYVTNGATTTNNIASATVNVPQDNYTLNPSANYIRLTNTSGGSVNITGINSTAFTNGSVITLVNVSTAPADIIRITNQDLGSLPGNRFDLPGGQPLILSQKGAATFIYDATLTYWELVSTN